MITAIKTIDLPRRFTRNEMYSFLDEIIDGDLKPTSNEFNFNFCTLTFIEPIGVTLLSNVFKWLLKRKIKVTLTHPDISVIPKEPIKYLDDSGFFKEYIGKYLNPTSKVRDTTIPLEHVCYSNSYQWLDTHFIPWLAKKLDVNISDIDDIRIILSELFNNIVDHSSEDIGCIYAQIYPNMDKIKICISDFGIGIPRKIQEIHPQWSDEKTLRKAIKPGFSTHSTPKNRGLGLDHLISSVVQFNNGEVYIHSNWAYLECKPSGSQNKASCFAYPSESYYPGTLFEIILDTKSYYRNEEEEYSW